MPTMLIFGLGYAAKALAARLRDLGWSVRATGRDGDLDFADAESVTARLGQATHVLSSVPPGEGDPVLARYGDGLAGKWLGYLSSTGVYGDTAGAWVDESAPTGGGRRTARSEADAAWLARGARVFRLPGIYGPGRSPLDRVLAGAAQRIDAPKQVFSRVHVDDFARGVVAALDASPGAYNLADDLPAGQNAVIEEACRLLGREPPPLLPLEQADHSPATRAFYAESRRVANGKAKRLLGWRPAYPTFREGLRALSAITSPTRATTDPANASAPQR